MLIIYNIITCSRKNNKKIIFSLNYLKILFKAHCLYMYIMNACYKSYMLASCTAVHHMKSN